MAAQATPHVVYPSESERASLEFDPCPIIANDVVRVVIGRIRDDMPVLYVRVGATNTTVAMTADEWRSLAGEAARMAVGMQRGGVR